VFFIIVILFVAYILTPLIDLILNERVRVPVKIGVYVIVTIWFIYVLITTNAAHNPML
jgi:hypothetical protein